MASSRKLRASVVPPALAAAGFVSWSHLARTIGAHVQCIFVVRWGKRKLSDSLRGKIANALGCHPTHVPFVLAWKPEQAATEEKQA